MLLATIPDSAYVLGLLCILLQFLGNKWTSSYAIIKIRMYVCLNIVVDTAVFAQFQCIVADTMSTLQTVATAVGTLTVAGLVTYIFLFRRRQPKRDAAVQVEVCQSY